MLRKALDHWRDLITGRHVAPAPALMPEVRADAYQSSPWFDHGWRLLAAGNRAGIEALLASAAAESRDAAERACLNAGWLLMCGDARAAEAQADVALKTCPDFSRLHLQRARALRMRGARRAALAAFQRATTLTPADAQAWAEQGDEHLAARELEEARDCYELALAHASDCVTARAGLARLLREAGAAEAALVHIQHALSISPQDPALHFESALIHSRCDDAAGSIAAYERALELKPDYAAACINVGLMYLAHRGNPQRAQLYFERAIELNPHSVAARANRGLALEEQGRADAALDYYEQLIAAFPSEDEYRWNRGMALLAGGDYARGWDDYEKRNARAGTVPRAFPYPEWGGGQLRTGGALLIYAEQGLGDEIMFASCVPDLLARGMHCVMECDTRVAALFARSFPSARVHGAARDGDRNWLAAYPEIEAQIAIASLPRLLRRSAADFRPHCGYLQADPLQVAQWQRRLAGDGAAVSAGITWRGGTAKTRRDLRSLTVSDLAPILRTPGVTFVNLQRDAGEALLEISACGARLLNYADALDDLSETAALLKALDAVVTVDNTVAHLAGALGCNTLILLPLSADWRWRRAGDSSPWYPAARLFRQQKPGLWTDVAGAVAQTLQAPDTP
ncbi:MAG: tetratricopeptide repeat protein [Burkholderiales bacterium]